MRKAIKWFGIAFGSLIVVAGLAAVYIVTTFNPNDYKADLIRVAQEKTGRTLQLKGDLHLAFFPSIGAKLGQAALSEPKSDKEFASVSEAVVSVKVMPLLSKQVVVDAVELKGLRANIRRDKAGQFNFDDLTGGDQKKKPEEKPAASPVKIDIDHVELTDADIAFLDQSDGAQYRLSRLNLKTGRIAPGATTPIELTAMIASDKHKAALDTKLKAKLTLDLERQIYRTEGLELTSKGKYGAGELQAKLDAPKLSFTKDQVDGTKVALDVSLTEASAKRSAKIEIGGLQGTFSAFKAAPLEADIELQGDGRTTKARLNGALTGNLDAKRFELPKLTLNGKVTDPKLPKGSFDVAINGTARADMAKETGAMEFSGRIDDSTVKGKAGITKFSPLTMSFDFEADQLDVDRLMGKSRTAKTADGKSAGEPTGSAGAAGGAKDEKIDLSGLKGVNAAGTLRIGKVTAFKVKAQQLRTDIRLAGGRLDVNPIAAQLYQGTMNGALSAEAGSNAIAIKQNLTGVAVGPLLRDAADIDTLEGKGNVSLDVTARGATVDALKKALNGTAAVNLADGAIKGIDIAGTLRDARTKIQELRGQKVQQSNKNEKTDFSELKATFNVKNGVAHNNDLSMKSPLLRVGGAGEIDIGNDRMNYLLRPTLVATSQGQGGKERSDVAGLTVPVKLTGPIASPQYSIDFAGMASEMVKGRVQDEIMKRIGGGSAGGKAPDGKAADAKSAPVSGGGNIADRLKGILGR